MSDMIFLGPKSYTEQDRNYFYGRDNEAKALFDLVNYSDFCVCYAGSGEGKTSLINAGVAPLLRGANMLPVNIRFDEGELISADGNEPDFDKIVWTKIEQELKRRRSEHGENLDFIPVVNAQPNGIGDSVWWKLRVMELRRNSFETITPVLIFDQFEEVFTRSRDMRWTDSFFSWLERLYRDEYEVAVAQEDGSGETATLNLPKHFKVLVSLRSDYVCELDYWSMTKHFIPSLKNNRYCLKPLTRKNALTVAGKLPEQNRCGLELDEIVRAAKVERAGDWDKVKQEDEARDKESMPCVSALVLSLILTSLDNDAQTIADKLKESGDNDDFTQLILNYVYDNAIEQCGLSRKSEKLWKMEETLIDGNGFRRRVPKTDACFKGLPLDKLAELHIINIINGDVEISHDSFRTVIANHNSLRRQRLERQNQRIKERYNKSVVWLLVIGSFLIAYLYLRFEAYKILIESLGTGNVNFDIFSDNCSWNVISKILMTAGICIVPTIVIWVIFELILKRVPKFWSLTSFGFGILLISCGIYYDLAFCPLPNAYSTYEDPAAIGMLIPAVTFLLTLKFCCSIRNRESNDNQKIRKVWISVLLLVWVDLICCLWVSLPETIRWWKIIVVVSAATLACEYLVIRESLKGTSRRRVWGFLLLNTVVLISTLAFGLGFNPFVVDCNSVVRSGQYKIQNIPWKTVLVCDNGKYGVVDALDGDTILPCIFYDVRKYSEDYSDYASNMSWNMKRADTVRHSESGFWYKLSGNVEAFNIIPSNFVVQKRVCRKSLEDCDNLNDSLEWLTSRVNIETNVELFNSIAVGRVIRVKSIGYLDDLLSVSQRINDETMLRIDSLVSKNSRLFDEDCINDILNACIPEVVISNLRQSVLSNDYELSYLNNNLISIRIFGNTHKSHPVEKPGLVDGLVTFRSRVALMSLLKEIAKLNYYFSHIPPIIPERKSEIINRLKNWCKKIEDKSYCDCLEEIISTIDREM